MRRGSWLLVLLASVLAGAPAHAAIKKYDFHNTSLTQGPNTDPNPDFVHFAGPPTPGSAILIDDSVPGSPKLLKLVDTGNVTTTIQVPGLAGFIFLSNADRTGPGVTSFLYHKIGSGQTPVFTGTGNTTAGSTIRWGITTGWTVTGGQWCNAQPDIICTFADRVDLGTTDPPFESEFYDLGTWFFHGTGFTSVPFIQQYFTTDNGNNSFMYYAPLKQDATVPALELLGLGILGASLATGGAVAIRRGKKK